MSIAEPMPLNIKEIRALTDPLLLPWLELYETAFPPEERNLIADILGTLLPGEEDGWGPHLLAAVDTAGTFAGMALYSVDGEAGTASLWYLAMLPELRGQGYGAALFADVVERVRRAGARAVFLEVEIPERAASPEARGLAARRIAFYRRLGCVQLGNVAYLQYVGSHQAPIPMHVMARPLVELTAEEIFILAGATFGEWLTRAGEPLLL